MKIPIYNSIYYNLRKTKDLNLKIINNPLLKKIDKFPSVKLLKYLPNTILETALISINDFFVYKFLENKISFEKLMKRF